MLILHPTESQKLVEFILDRLGDAKASEGTFHRIHMMIRAHCPMADINLHTFERDSHQFAQVIMALQYPSWDTSDYSKETMACITIARSHVEEIAPQYLT